MLERPGCLPRGLCGISGSMHVGWETALEGRSRRARGCASSTGRMSSELFAGTPQGLFESTALLFRSLCPSTS